MTTGCGFPSVLHRVLLGMCWKIASGRRFILKVSSIERVMQVYAETYVLHKRFEALKKISKTTREQLLNEEKMEQAEIDDIENLFELELRNFREQLDQRKAEALHQIQQKHENARNEIRARMDRIRTEKAQIKQRLAEEMIPVVSQHD